MKDSDIRVIFLTVQSLMEAGEAFLEHVFFSSPSSCHSDFHDSHRCMIPRFSMLMHFRVYFDKLLHWIVRINANITNWAERPLEKMAGIEDESGYVGNPDIM